VKKYNLIFLSVIACILLGYSSCKKINEATTLGGDLIPPIDNINTFEKFFETQTFNRSNLNDSGAISFYDDLAIGHIESDPVFGKTTADAFFSIGRPFYNYPFVGKKDSITIDSVILALSYQDSYGDTNSTLTYTVSEIAQNSNFKEDTFYNYLIPPFATSTQLGTKSFQINTLNDSIYVFTPGDTMVRKQGNVLRIPLDKNLGVRFKNYDTAANGAFKSDSLFKENFKGLAVTSSQSGNGLAYFSGVDNKTKLIIYYKSKINGVDSSLSTEFYHIPLVVPSGFKNGQANSIRRTPGGEWATALASPNTAADKLYIQSTPGSFAYIKIPALDTLGNKVIHRAELIIPKLSSAMDNVFGPPQFLWLDRINQADHVPSTLHNDVLFTTNSYDVQRFGGQLKSDNTYRFAITRHVQGIVSRKESNDTLRLHAPYRVTLFDKNFNGKQIVSVLDEVAKGRVVVAGGNHPSTPIRLRVVYSNY
jgi:hypothetical protein